MYSKIIILLYKGFQPIVYNYHQRLPTSNILLHTLLGRNFILLLPHSRLEGRGEYNWCKVSNTIAKYVLTYVTCDVSHYVIIYFLVSSNLSKNYDNWSEHYKVIRKIIRSCLISFFKLVWLQAICTSAQKATVVLQNFLFRWIPCIKSM